MTLAPGLDDVLVSSTPPSIAFLRTVPLPIELLIWGVYVVIMVDRHGRFRLYIGSGTSVSGGVIQRATNYHQTASNLPGLVKKAFEDGFSVHHVGLLCWTPIPRPGLVPKIRGRVLAIEAALACSLHVISLCRLMKSTAFLIQFVTHYRLSS
jgi:hypothetical protein